MMKERPILFSSQMVNAILEGRKTQTRRIVKGTPLDWLEKSGFTPKFVADAENGLCPYGQVGDRLWVRETHQVLALDSTICAYRASCPDDSFNYVSPVDSSVQQINVGIWKPSIFMPRWASRLTLEITNVRVEKLKSIKVTDAIAEGIEYDVSKPDGGPITRFMMLWDKINGKRASWESNPFVWVIEFKKL